MMETDEFPLVRLQRWMQAVITHPDGVASGIDSPAARELIDVKTEDVETVISRSRALSSVDRLAVYGHAYYARLIECMAAEYPAVRQAVGEEAFSGFVFGYLQEYPSTSYTLSDLGTRFPQYLSATRPVREAEQPDWADFLVDVATLERVYSEVFDGPGEEEHSLIAAEDLQGIPADQWGEVRLETTRSLKLVELQFPAHQFITAARRDESSACPEPQPTYLAVNRREYIVRRRPLPRLGFYLLLRLQSGETLGAAIESAVSEFKETTDDLSGQLRSWFRDWTAAGYFIAAKC